MKKATKKMANPVAPLMSKSIKSIASFKPSQPTGKSVVQINLGKKSK
jgi:hypothetical protein